MYEAELGGILFFIGVILFLGALSSIGLGLNKVADALYHIARTIKERNDGEV